MAGSIDVAILLKVRDEASAVLNSVGDKLKGFGKSAISMGSDISNGLRPVTNVLEGIVTDSVNMASATEESLNKLRVVFGDSSADIEAWAKNSSSNLGLSTQKAEEAAGTFGNLFTAMGVGKKPAADFSQNILQLAADMASFNNIRPEDAIEKLRAGLVGEAEPLRTLGVNLTEAGVKAYALAHGIGESGRELTGAEKLQARYGLILEQTTSAQGDFARTSDGLANKLRIQTAEQENVKAQLGQALIPIMLKLTEIISGVVKWFSNLSPEMKNVILVIGGLIVVAGPLITIIGVATIAIGGMATAFALLTGPIGLVVLAITLLALVWATNLGDIQGKTAAVLNYLAIGFNGWKLIILTVFRDVVNGVTGAINGVIGILNGFIDGYNALAAKLGLPILGKIELLTPNLSAVDMAISRAARDRSATITAVYTTVGAPNNANYWGQGPYAEGTSYVPFTGPAIVHRGEAIIPADQNPFTAGGANVTVNIGTVDSDARVQQLATAIDDIFRRRRMVAGGAA